jgi:membrane protease YdiL (CAAX protease family)
VPVEAWRWRLGSGAQIAHAVAISFFVVSHFIVGFVIVGPLLGVEDPFEGSAASIVMTAVQGVYGYVVVIGLALMLVNHVKVRELGWRLDQLLGVNIALGIGGAIALVIVMFGPMIALGRVELGETLHTITTFTIGQRVQMALIGLLAATIEETVFRGYLHRGLVERLGFPAGLVLGAIVFGLYHLPMGIPLPAIGAKIASGLVLGALRGKDRSLVAPATAHFVFWQIAGFA